MRGKGYIGRTLAGMMAAVLMLTSVPFTVYATEAGTSAETVSEQEENLREEEAAQEDEKKDKSEGESKENGDDSESGEEQIGEWNGEADQEEDEKDGEKLDNGEKEDDHDTDDTEEEPGEQDISEEMVSENSMEKTEDVLRTDLQSSLSVKGRNSVGNMLAEALSDKAEEQLESNGYNVFSVEMDGQTAEVSFETLEDAVLTVAIYDESGKRLLTSGSCDVSAGDKIAEIEITEAIPQYFYVRSFLTDKETLQPLCLLYDSPMYTEEMQKFLSMTTDDFDEDRVLNLDDDKTNNFAIYNENAIVIPDKDGINILVSADEENYIYVIENVDESITSLEAGDIFVYEYTDDDLLIVKIVTIEVDGTTATITGEKLSMEEVFDYVKIDTEAGLQEAEIDASGLEEGVIYEGLVPYSDVDVETYAIDVGGKGSAATSIKFVEKNLGDGVKLSGGLDFSLEVATKVYLSFKYQYFEIKFDYSVKLQGSISAERTGEGALKIPLPNIGINPIPCVGVTLNPCFVLEAKGEASWSGTLKGSIGFSVSGDEGVKSLTSTPQYKSEIKAEISVFLGISLEPEVEVISEKIAEASLEAAVGVEVKGTMAYKKPSASEVHECKHCIDGDIAGKLKVNFKAKLFNKDSLSFKAGIEKTIHLYDFYYSLDFNEFGWGKCPRYLYKIVVTVTDQNGMGVKEANITVVDGFYVWENVGDDQNGLNIEDSVLKSRIVTGDSGMAIGYLAAGEYTLEVSKEKYDIIKKKIQVVDKEKAFRINYKTDGENGGNTGNDMEIEKESVRFDLGLDHSGIIADDGSLYMWGSGVYIDGITATNTPMKVFNNAISIGLGYYATGCVTSDHGLYMWGNDGNCILGDGDENEELKYIPVKVLDNVKMVDQKWFHSAAVTMDGMLYVWGCDEINNVQNNIPIKAFEHVKTVSLGMYHSGFITEDDELYMWGQNECGQLGDGTTDDKDRNNPVKVLDNVAVVSLGSMHSGAITKDGSLYMWGSNGCGELGIGKRGNYICTPTKVLDNVIAVSLGDYYSGVITKDGNLYMWGANNFGKLGDGTSENYRVTPIKY